MLKEGVDATTVNVLADELIAKKRAELAAPAAISKISWLLKLARAVLGSRSIADISAVEVLSVLRKVDERGRHESVRRLRAVIGEIFRYAIASGRASADPTFALRGALPKNAAAHRPALIAPKAFGALLRAIDGYAGTPEVRAPLQLLALTFVRPGELRRAEWSEIDLESLAWTIPSEKTKKRRPHKVPLAPQALTIVTALQRITGSGRFVFPSVRSPVRPISENALNPALRRMGIAK